MAESNAESFEDLVARWLRTTQQRRVQPDFQRVTKVVAYGTDWEGDTEGGFYSTADLTISYERADGTIGHYDVEGEAMQSLWEFVMHAWPAPVTANPQ